MFKSDQLKRIFSRVLVLLIALGTVAGISLLMPKSVQANDDLIYNWSSWNPVGARNYSDPPQNITMHAQVHSDSDYCEWRGSLPNGSYTSWQSVPLQTVSGPGGYKWGEITVSPYRTTVYQLHCSDILGWGLPDDHDYSEYTQVINPVYVPITLSASTAGCPSTTVNLSWNSHTIPNQGETYTLKRNGQVIYTGSLLSHTDSNLLRSNTYTYEVSIGAVNDSVSIATSPENCETASLTDILPDNQTVTPGTTLPLRATFEWMGADYSVSFEATLTAPDGTQTILDRKYKCRLRPPSFSACRDQAPYSLMYPSGMYSFSSNYTFSQIGQYTIQYRGFAKSSDNSTSVDEIVTKYVTVSGGPDLIASNPSASKTTVASGESVSFSGLISNIGSTAAGASITHLQLSYGGHNGTGVLGTLAELSTPALGTTNPGNSTTVSTPNNFYTVVSNNDFRYSVRFCADTRYPSLTGEINESNENNNCSPWLNINVVGNSGHGETCGATVYDSPCPSSSASDLVASTPTPSSAVINNPTTFQSTISNNGNSSTGGAFSNFFQVASAANGGGSISDMSATSMSSLAAFSSNTAFSPAHTFTSVGTYSVRACADKSSASSAGSIAESNENNNCSGWQNITVSSGSNSTINVTSNLPTTWTITQDRLDSFTYIPNIEGAGTSGSYQVMPGANGTLYTMFPEAKQGYAVAVTNSVSGNGSSFSLWGGETELFTITYTAEAGGGFNYSLSNSGNTTVTKESGNAFAQNTITKTLLSDSSQSVDLSLTGNPTGVSYSIANQSCNPTCSSVVTFTVAPTTANGTYPITVTGTPLNKQTTFNLVVQGNPVSVTCVPSPAVALVGEEVTWTANVSGGTPPHTYSWSGTGIPASPAPTSNPYRITYSTVGQKNAIVTVNDSASHSAVCSSSSVQVNLNPKFEEF